MRKTSFVAHLLVLVLLVAAVSCSGGGGGSSSPMEPVGPKTVTVTINDNSFSPQSVVVQPGDTVRWVLAGSYTHHTVTDESGAFDSGATFTAPGASFSYRFTTGSTTFNYYCKAHKACCMMQGSVRVGDTAPAPKPGY
ncbi:MAG: plastocyanin/azurin family copper-binding protein [Acidobacteriota bacterium]|nr:plastocyanin/azurin family copper-binding protein [Acidobacteriota bacterium]